MLFFPQGARGRETCDTGCFYTVAIADNKYKVKIILNIFRGVCGDTRLLMYKSANAENRFSIRTQIRRGRRTRVFFCFVPLILNYHVANRAFRVYRTFVPMFGRFVYSLFLSSFFCAWHLHRWTVNRHRTVIHLAERNNIPILPVGLAHNSCNRCKLKSLYCSLVMDSCLLFASHLHNKYVYAI